MKTKIQILKKNSALILSAFAAALPAQASSDYGPAIWNPACNGHWYTSGNGHKFHVIHDMEGYYLSTISYFQNCNTQASVHYCVNGLKDTSTDHAAGEITQMVLEAYYAWHVCCWNQYCTGTEHEGFASNPAWYTEAMYQASSGISAHEADKFGYAKDRNHIVGHNEWQNTNWHSWAASNFGINTSCNTHTDPGIYWDWSHYMDLVTGGTSDPAAVSWATNRIDVFARGSTGSLVHRWCNTNTWSTWETLSGTMSGSPCASSRGSGSLDVFYRGTDNALWHKWYDAGVWNGPENLGGILTSDPGSTSWSANRMDVFARGTDNGLWHRGWDNGPGWANWESLGNVFTGHPAASCSGTVIPGLRLDVFVRDMNNNLAHIYFDTVAWKWSAWQGLGGVLTSSPASASWSTSFTSVFVRGADNGFWQDYYNGSSWSGFQSFGGYLTSGPGMSSWGVGRLDVFGRGNLNHLYTLQYTGTWSSWIDLGVMP